MHGRTPCSATPLLIVAVIAIAIILCGAACFPSSVTDGGWAAFIAAVVPLLVYFSVGMWARCGSARIHSALRVGTFAGSSIAAIGVLYHLVEISTSLPASMSDVLGGGMWGAMFLTFGIACSTTFRREKSIGLGVLSSAWCGMMYAAVLVACALTIGYTFMPHMQQILAPLYSTSGMQDPQFVGLVSGVTCLFLNSMRRQAALVISMVAMLVFAAGVESIRFAASLERAQRPPFVVFGLAALAVTLASAHPLFLAIRSPRSPRESLLSGSRSAR
jgi:hypothetical protein